MKSARWIVGAVLLVVVLCLIALGHVDKETQVERLVARGLYVLILAAVLCLFRVARGPTAADRIVAVDIFGVLIVGFCAIASVASGKSWYIDIGIAWALQSFIGSLALSKYLEGKALDG